MHIEGLVVPKGAERSTKKTLAVQDVVTLLTNDTTIYRGREVKELFANAYRFELVMGLRPGEVIALRHEDRDGKVLHIRGAINRYNELTHGKNENAVRTFIMPTIALQVLEQQAALLKKLGIVSPYIFPNELGMHIHPETYYTRWCKYRDHIGLSKITPYELRHTFFSACKPIPKPFLDPVAGHSPTMDTFGVYGHEMDGDLQYVADEIDGIFTKLLDNGQEVSPNVSPQ